MLVRAATAVLVASGLSCSNGGNREWWARNRPVIRPRPTSTGGTKALTDGVRPRPRHRHRRQHYRRQTGSRNRWRCLEWNGWERGLKDGGGGGGGSTRAAEDRRRWRAGATTHAPGSVHYLWATRRALPRTAVEPSQGLRRSLSTHARRTSTTKDIPVDPTGRLHQVVGSNPWLPPGTTCDPRSSTSSLEENDLPIAVG